MKAINFVYEVDGESLRAYAIPSGDEYTLDFLREEDVPADSKELYSTCPIDSLFYSLDSLLKGLVIEPRMMSQLDECKLIKDAEGFRECEMQIPMMGAVRLGIEEGDFSPIENIKLSSAQKQDMLAYLGYDKIREVNEWFEECKKRLCVRSN